MSTGKTETPINIILSSEGLVLISDGSPITVEALEALKSRIDAKILEINGQRRRLVALVARQRLKHKAIL